MNDIGAPTVDLQTAADELGVHYQTAYRWVRSGRLAAEMVGGKYLVVMSDLAEFDRSRRAPTAPPPPKRVRLEHASESIHTALLDGDETAARKITRRLAEDGAPILDLIQDVLSPALQRIGQGWQDGELTIWAEHRASAIVERLLGELVSNPRGRRRGVAAVAALAGDRHSLPTTMAAAALRGDNWHVHHLGADLPTEQFRQFCETHDVSVAVVTVTNLDVDQLAISMADELRAAGTPTIVGGPGQSLDRLIEQARAAAS